MADDRFDACRFMLGAHHAPETCRKIEDLYNTILAAMIEYSQKHGGMIKGDVALGALACVAARFEDGIAEMESVAPMGRG